MSHQNSHSFSGKVTGHANHIHVGDVINHGPTNDSTVERLRSSLTFTEIWARYHAIAERHDGTYDWLLPANTLNHRTEYGGADCDADTDSDTEHSRSELVLTGPYRLPEKDRYDTWLEDDTLPTYWVSGNPGSGKSTLMKHLFHVCKTTHDTKNQVVLSFWFWEAGSHLQRSLEGCLRSLLCQVFDGELGEELGKRLTFLQDPALRTLSGLKKAIVDAISYLSHKGFLTIVFLDGIDESVDDSRAVLDLVEEIGEKMISRVKFCISSRPEQLFTDALSDFPNLKLHDLNRFDIDKVIEEKFLSRRQVSKLLKRDAYAAQRIRRQLRDRAGGVFLWVHLAIRDLLIGVDNRDDIEGLLARLSRLPAGLDELYSVMLRRSDVKNCRSTAALYFKWACHKRTARYDQACYPYLPHSVFDFCVATNSSYRRDLLSLSPQAMDVIAQERMLEDAVVWLRVRSGGLLEVREEDQDVYTSSDKDSDKRVMLLNRFTRQVNFIHRTARTYILETNTGKDLLSASSLDDSAFQRICFETGIAKTFILYGLWQEWEKLRQLRNIACGECVTPSSADIVTLKNVMRDLITSTDVPLSYHDDLPLCQSEESSENLGLIVHSDGTLDFARMWARLGWYEHALIEIELPASTQADKLQLTWILYEACVYLLDACDRFPSSESHDALKRLAIRLNRLGADWSHFLPTPCGTLNTFRASLGAPYPSTGLMEWMIDNLDPFQHGETDVYFLTVTSIVHAEPLMGLIYAQDDLRLFGDFSLQLLSLWRAYWKTSSRSRRARSRIYFVADLKGYDEIEAHSGSVNEWTAGRIIGISEADSDALIFHLESLAEDLLYSISEVKSAGSTVWLEVFASPHRTSDREISADIQERVRASCKRGKTINTVAEALDFVGAQERVDQFLATQKDALRKGNMSEDDIDDFIKKKFEAPFMPYKFYDY